MRLTFIYSIYGTTAPRDLQFSSEIKDYMCVVLIQVARRRSTISAQIKDTSDTGEFEQIYLCNQEIAVSFKKQSPFLVNGRVVSQG